MAAMKAMKSMKADKAMKAMKSMKAAKAMKQKKKTPGLLHWVPPPYHCAHDRRTYSGSNQYVSVQRCELCGEVFKISRKNDASASATAAVETPVES